MTWLLLLATINSAGGIEAELPAEEWVTIEVSEQVFLAEVVDTEETEEAVGRQDVSADWLDVYPQPAREVLFVAMNYSFGEEVHVELFDVLGCRVHREVFSGPRTAIDVSQFTRGVYFFSARIGDARRLIQKVILN